MSELLLTKSSISDVCAIVCYCKNTDTSTYNLSHHQNATRETEKEQTASLGWVLLELMPVNH